MLKVKNVSPADIFMYKNKRAIVLDICEVKSMITGEVVEYKCFAKMIDGYATNLFEIPFSTVAKNKL